ncbi:MAG TPA: AMP-binding protein, partial [Thermoleophilaceae bacterium]|nr:AMP-binding protein [Thermoleophilaceae bacterium]
MRFGDRSLSYAELAAAAAAVVTEVGRVQRLAVWAEPTLETCVAVAAAVGAGIPLVPMNPKLGHGELRHVLEDSRPDAILGAPDGALPGDLDHPPRRLAVDVDRRGGEIQAHPRGPEDTALIVYTSGTTGAPKGAVLP